jgi:hypothetical protein
VASNDLAKLVVKLEAQTAQYDASLKKAAGELRKFRGEVTGSLGKVQKQFADFGKTMLRTFAVGSLTAAVYGLTRAVASSIQAGDDLAKFAAKSGLAAEAASELAHAAKMADLDLGSLETGIKKMQVSLSKAGSGSKETQQTLAALGLTFKDIKDLSPDKQFEVIAEQISRLKDPADRTRAAVELFGKSGADLLPLFEQGAEGIRKAREEAQQLGKSFSSEDLKRFQEADDAFKRLAASGSSLADIIAIKLSPAITGAVDNLTKLLSGDFDKSWLFRLLAAPPNVNLLNFIRTLTTSTKELQEVASSGPTGRTLPGLDKGKEAPGFKGIVGDLDKLKPVVVTATRVMVDFNQMLKDTETDAQSAARAYEVFKIQLTSLLNQGLLGSGAEGLAEFNKRLKEFQDAAIPEVEVTAKAKIIEGALKEVSTFAEQAARNMQDSFADFLFDPFSDGIRGMLKGFIDVLRRMVAEAAAASIFESLFKGSGGLGGFFGTLLSGIGAGVGTRASGGPVTGGNPYIVGEKGPELFVPGSSGSIVPNGMGGVVVNVGDTNINGSNLDQRQMAAVLKVHREATIAEIVTGLQRNRYRLAAT